MRVTMIGGRERSIWLVLHFCSVAIGSQTGTLRLARCCSVLVVAKMRFLDLASNIPHPMISHIVDAESRSVCRVHGQS